MVLFIVGLCCACFVRLLELGKETSVVFREQPQIVDTVEQIGDTFHADTKGEAAIYVRINTAIFQNGGVHHAAAQDFHPPQMVQAMSISAEGSVKGK